MYIYAKYCPVAAATNVVGDFWTPLILRELLYGTERFNQLARNVPGISRSLLIARLRALQRAGVLVCEREGKGNATAYRLTPAGRALEPVIDALNAWGTAWGMPAAEVDEVDPLVAICMFKSRMRTRLLPRRRFVIEVVVAAGGKETRAWLVCEDGQVSMCFDPPRFDVDLFVRSDAMTLYAIWMERLPVAAALAAGLVIAEGERSLAEGLGGWFETPAGVESESHTMAGV